MRDLLIFDFNNNQYGVWEDDLLCCAETRYISHLPLLPDYIAGICSIEKGHSITLADLSVCIGLPVAAQQKKASAFLLSEDKNFAGFCVYGEVEKISIAESCCCSIPEYLSSEVIHQSVIFDQAIIPIINVQVLFKRLLNKQYLPPEIDFCLPSLKVDTINSLSSAHFFSCAGELIACPAYLVEKVIPLFRRLVVLPAAPDYVTGMMEHEGLLIPVIYLAHWLDVPTKQVARSLFITCLDGHYFGFLVEKDFGEQSEDFQVYEFPDLLRQHCLQQALLVKEHVVPLIDFNLLVTSQAADEDNHFPLKPQFYSKASTRIKFGKTPLKIVPFSLLGLHHAVPKDEVKEILPLMAYQTPLKPHSFIQGVVYYANHLLPVIDLANCFGRRSIVSDDWKMLFIENGNFRALILAETVDKERELSSSEQQKLPFESEYPVVYGCYPRGVSVDLILNIETIIAHADKAIVKQFFDSYGQKVNRNFSDTSSHVLEVQAEIDNAAIITDVMAAFDEWDKVISPSEKEHESEELFVDENEGVIESDESVNVSELEQDRDDEDEVETLIELQEVAEEGISISELEAFEAAVQLSEPLDDLAEEPLNADEFLAELENDDAEPLPLLEEWVEASAQEFDDLHQNIASDVADNPDVFFEPEPEIIETIVRIKDFNDEEIVTFTSDENSSIDKQVEAEDFLADLKEVETEPEEIPLEVLDDEPIEKNEDELLVPESETIDLDAFADEPLEESLDDESFLTVLEESEAESEEIPLEVLADEPIEKNEDELLVANPEIALETFTNEKIGKKSADSIELEQEQNEVLTGSVKNESLEQSEVSSEKLNSNDLVDTIKKEDELESQRENEIVSPVMTSSLEYDFSTVSVENEKLVASNSSNSSDKPETTQGQRKTYYAAGMGIVLLGATYYWYDFLKTTEFNAIKSSAVANEPKQILAKNIEEVLQPVTKQVEQPITQQLEAVAEKEKSLLQQQLVVAKEVEQAIIKQLETEPEQIAVVIEKERLQPVTEQLIVAKKVKPLEIIAKVEPEKIPTEISDVKKALVLSVNLSQEQKKHEEIAASGTQYRKEYFRIRMMLPKAQEGAEQNQVQSFEKCTTINYTIKKEDTLFDIAERFTGNGFNYKKIARYNKIKNPSQLYWGTMIKIKNVKNMWCVKKDQA